MAIHRGIQSAIFYYLSCAPCSEARYRRNRKAEAERGRLERQLLEEQMPHHYRQPSPSSTNPHWQSEIDAGPHLSVRGKRRTPANGLDNQPALHTTLSVTDSNGSKRPSTVHLPERTASRRSDASFPLAPAVTPPERARTREKPSPESFRSYRNPQVNDLHPAVVTDVESKAEAAWLMEPPPIADIMTGRDRAGRARSDSNGSRPSTRGTPVARQLSNRIVQRQLGAGGSSASLALSRERSASVRSGVPPTVPQESSLESGQEQASNTASQPTAATAFLSPESAASVRPQLPTIPSGSQLPTETSVNPQENSEPAPRANDDSSLQHKQAGSRRSGVVVRDSSMKVLQELAPHSKILNAQIYTSTGSPTAESEIELPAADEEERRRLNSGEDLFDTWYTSDFQLDTWIHEHTKREVRQRWSMDI